MARRNGISVLALVAACLLLAWTGGKQGVNFHSAQNQAAVSVVEINAPYDFAHDANYGAMVQIYTSQNRTHDLPF